MVDKVENPYEKMTADVLQQHIDQMSEVVKGKGIDVTQAFGIAAPSISADDQAKLEKFDSLTSEVEKLTAEASAKDLSPEAVATTQVGIDGLVAQIASIDADVDVSKIGSKFNNLERMSILNDVKPLIEEYAGRIALVKKEIGSKGTDEVTQTFSAPKPEVSAADMIKSVTSQ